MPARKQKKYEKYTFHILKIFSFTASIFYLTFKKASISCCLTWKQKDFLGYILKNSEYELLAIKVLKYGNYLFCILADHVEILLLNKS